MIGSNQSRRIEALLDYKILDTEPEPIFDALTRVAAHIFGVSTSLITFVEGHRQWFKSRFGFARSETGLDESFCLWAMEGRDVLVVPDAAMDLRFADNPLVKSGAARFYAGAPLVTSDDRNLGTICVLDRESRNPTSVQVEMLQELARITMKLLEARRSGIDFAANKDLVHGLADNSPGGLFEFARDRSGRHWLNFASRGFVDTIGIAPDVAVDDIDQVFANVHADDLRAFIASIDEAYVSVARWEHQFRVVHPVKGTISVFGVSHPVRNQGGTVTWQGCLMDVTDRVAEQERLEEARRTLSRQYRELTEYQMLLDQIARMARIGAWAVDLETGHVSWTPEVYALHGVPQSYVPTLEGALGFCAPEVRSRLERKVEDIIVTGKAMEMDYPIRTPAGEKRWLRTIGEAEYGEDGTVTRLIGSIQDITSEKELLAQALHHSSHDHMTGLPNRASFFRRLECMLSGSAPGISHALLFFDLDHFKDINDAFGYQAGDEALREVARRLEEQLAHVPSAFVSRFGGDEFAVLVEAAPGDHAIEEMARNIKANITREMSVAGRSVTSGVSMGISLSAGLDETAGSLFKKADLALRHAKQAGRARFVLFSDELASAAARDQELKREIVEGVKRREFEVYYQPVMDLRASVLNGFEALLRWHHPNRGLVSAGIFSHLIDDPAVGGRLSDLVLDQVIATAASWTRSRLPFGQIAVNISSAQLRDPSFLDRLNKVGKAGLSPASIKLEITEGVLLGRTAEKASQVLHRIRDMGFDIALDDFGTGYASLVHLTQFPITQLKIDMSFVRNMAVSEKDRTIVQTMCSLAEGLHLTAVAEGIEDEVTERMLRVMGCRFGQGYHYAKALPKNEAEQFISAAISMTPGTVGISG